MPAYSPRAQKALAFLFRTYNDIDVYVEDSVARNFYEILINRILGDKAKVTRVIQLGGRKEVLEECQRHQQVGHSRPCLFIIDGDFDVVRGSTVPPIPHLYQLQVYCSENLVFCGKAALEVAVDHLSNSPRSDVQRVLDYDSFTRNIERCLMSLFVTYAVVNALSPEIETSGYHVNRLCQRANGQDKLDPNKVRARRRALLLALRPRHNPKDVASRLMAIRRTVRNRGLTIRHVASGKTYLLPLLRTHLQRTAHYIGSVETLKVQLARHCQLDFEEGFQRAVLNAART